jgi:(1->4)-alpha-D-glucan 1-alpha-D-glucosylmutase
VTLAPRLVLGLAGEWADTTVALPEGRWRDVLTGDCGDGGERNVAELLARFPVALLERA